MLIVSTCRKPPESVVARAKAVAARCGCPLIERRSTSVSKLMKLHGATLIYMVGRQSEEIRAAGLDPLFVHPGRFYLKRVDGLEHPLLRALAPPQAKPVNHVIDATVGLAQDALQIAGIMGATVHGIEASAPVSCLLEEGLARMAAQTHRGFAKGASQITVQHGQAAEVLASMDTHSAPVVYLDPMFDTPLAAESRFDVFRHLAQHRPLDSALLEQAHRVAERRVVLKVPGASPEPTLKAPGPGWNRRVRGRAVDYLVIEKELALPTYECPDLGQKSRRRQRSDVSS